MQNAGTIDRAASAKAGEIDIPGLRALLAAATSGPLRVEWFGPEWNRKAYIFGEPAWAVADNVAGRDAECWAAVLNAAPALLDAAEERDLLRAEVADLKLDVIAFCALHAGAYARTYGLPDGHLHPQHYDTLARCGARMDSFTRAALAKETPNA